MQGELKGGRTKCFRLKLIRTNCVSLHNSLSNSWQRKGCFHSAAVFVCFVWAGQAKLVPCIRCQKWFLPSSHSPWIGGMSLRLSSPPNWCLTNYSHRAHDPIRCKPLIEATFYISPNKFSVTYLEKEWVECCAAGRIKSNIWIWDREYNFGWEKIFPRNIRPRTKQPLCNISLYLNSPKRTKPSTPY